MINMVYLFKIVGFNRVWTYMIHEFFHIKGRRSFVGGYFSKRSPNFWLMPLRMFVGVSWIISGLDKLPKILKNPSNIFLIPTPYDAASSASVQAGASTSEKALWVPHFVEKLVNKVMDLLFYTDGKSPKFNGLASVFQAGMVVAEIIVGVLLVIGLFSAIASIVSILMCIMIYSSSMASNEILWFGFASIALIAGSGSTFGCDYYVLPWLKKRWKRLGFVRKGYLYTDDLE
jgi:NADH dehydrogenase